MVDGHSPKEFIDRCKAFFQNLGKKSQGLESALRSGGEKYGGTTLSTAMQSDKLSRMGNYKPAGKAPANQKEPWKKLKESAKAADPPESNIDHWNNKQASFLAGTTFDAATTDVSNGRARKRPSVVTQARITSNRLQALQAELEKPKNSFDNVKEEDDGHGPSH